MSHEQLRPRLGVVVDGAPSLSAGRREDPVAFVVLRSTFLNPPRAAAARRMTARIHERHRDAEVIPYAWHYLTHEPGDGIEAGSNRSLDPSIRDYGHLRGAGAAQGWEVTRICAEACGAKHIVLRTPPSFSPSSLSRRRLTQFMAERSGGELGIIWEPEGLWTPAEAAAFATPLGVEVMGQAFGMTGQLLELEGARWLRIGGGKDARLRASHAEILVHELMDHDVEDVQISFEGPRAYGNLRAFARALEEFE